LKPSDHAFQEEVDGLDIGGHVIDGLFFCAKLTGCRGDHTPFVQARRDKSDTSEEAVKPDQGSSWEGHSGGGRCRCWG